MVLVIYVRLTLYTQFPIANGYAAKKMCSCIFIADRSQESVQKDDLGFGPLGMTKTIVDHANKEVTTSIFGLAKRTAKYKGDVGCVLLQGEDDYNVSLQVNRPSIPSNKDWPIGA